MKTRSQTSNAQYEVNIDFDESSIEWRKNKKYIGNGEFKYKIIYDKLEDKVSNP